MKTITLAALATAAFAAHAENENFDTTRSEVTGEAAVVTWAQTCRQILKKPLSAR